MAPISIFSKIVACCFTTRRRSSDGKFTGLGCRCGSTKRRWEYSTSSSKRYKSSCESAKKCILLIDRIS
ncbi:unnamed protein product [Albugo candida]|uniref:Uncharacterized protein n=1 Tax=Albugo candida TaxID=65357 RepID=A0A024GLI7_9STRA|nr:unnamed protein product [Albugo candida]|eukprot:CCI47590.1 unnamed protein product [Albugo candida]